MYITTAELKREIQDEIKCPTEWIRHLAYWGFFRKLKNAIQRQDKNVQKDLIAEMKTGYIDYCRDVGFDPNADNRRKSTDYFIYLCR